MITSGLKFLQLIFDEKVPRKVYNVKSEFISEYSAGNREHCPQNSREQGTLVKKQPGTGNIGLKTAGNREHRTPPFRVSSVYMSGYCLISVYTSSCQSIITKTSSVRWKDAMSSLRVPSLNSQRFRPNFLLGCPNFDVFYF